MEGAKSTSGASAQDVSTKVKTIMNQTYQMMSSKFKTKDSYQSKEILVLIVNVIKVGVWLFLGVCDRLHLELFHE